ncbi:MAG TPA: isoprenylcysteine carboxylmethyltransferase family protein [Thermoanaerobaculia bacterium]|nr:isoprenylcysteine carboxylmethyltransferase family protein [Thermoanaerobaculia bacterium]
MNEPSGGSTGIRFPPPLLYVVALAVGFFLQHRWPVPVAPGHPRVASAAGAVLVVLGLGLAVGGVMTFRRAGTSPNPTRPTRALTIAGPYRFTRNPMYLGLALASAGAAVASNALWPFLLVVPAAALMVPLVIAREERYLEGKFGDEYVRYRSSVRRWI